MTWQEKMNWLKKNGKFIDVTFYNSNWSVCYSFYYKEGTVDYDYQDKSIENIINIIYDNCWKYIFDLAINCNKNLNNNKAHYYLCNILKFRYFNEVIFKLLDYQSNTCDLIVKANWDNVIKYLSNYNIINISISLSEPVLIIYCCKI